MKINTLIFLFVLLIAGKPGFSQAGYQGLRNEISIDAVNLAYYGELNLMYKFTVDKSISLFANYIHDDFTLSMKDPQGYYLEYYDQFTQVSYGNGDVVSGESQFSMSTFGFGLLATRNNCNMNMPVGLYWGLGVYLSNGELTDIYTLQPGLPGSGMPIKYDVNQFNLRLIYGYEFVLTGKLTMDLSLGLGITKGKYKLQNPPSSGLESEYPFAPFPQITFKGHNQNEDWDFDSYNSVGPKTYKNLNFFVAPSVRIGYIF